MKMQQKLQKRHIKKATTLKEAALNLALLTEEEFDQYVDPKTMIYPNAE